MEEKLVIRGVYQHYKNPEHIYVVLNISLSSETTEELVTYEQLYTGSEFKTGTLWTRPKKMFLENIVVDGNEVPRFKYLKIIL